MTEPRWVVLDGQGVIVRSAATEQAAVDCMNQLKGIGYRIQMYSQYQQDQMRHQDALRQQIIGLGGSCQPGCRCEKEQKIADLERQLASQKRYIELQEENHKQKIDDLERQLSDQKRYTADHDATNERKIAELECDILALKALLERAEKQTASPPVDYTKREIMETARTLYLANPAFGVEAAITNARKLQAICD